nr:unnamed protein product [Callosobruchus chinensis]
MVIMVRNSFSEGSQSDTLINCGLELLLKNIFVVMNHINALRQ